MIDRGLKFHATLAIITVVVLGMIGMILLIHGADFSKVTGNKLVVATDKTRHVVCYRFAYHDGIYCMKDERKKAN